MKLLFLSFGLLALYLMLALFLSWREAPRNRDRLRRLKL
jgi:hypothetical protein